MIIKNIKIKNYKTYLSLDLDLSISPNRPIVLIGGMNGGGKTTLFEAICGALYGLKIRNKEHFVELFNNGAMGHTDPEIVLELTFVGMVLGQEQKYILRRIYKLNPSEMPVESVSLNMNGNQFVFGTAMTFAQRAQAEQQVNKIIKANLPQELSKYFLFDAMQSSDLLKENVFAQIIRDNIENVMGFNKYIQLERASERLQQEWAAKRLAAQKEADEYNNLCKQKSDLELELNQNTIEQDRLYKFMVNIKDEYEIAKDGAKAIADNRVKIEDLKSKIEDTKRAAANYNEQLKSVVDALELNVFIPKMISNISLELNDVIRSKEEIQRKIGEQLSLEQLQDITNQILKYLKKNLLCVEGIDDEKIVAYLRKQQMAQEGILDKYSYLDGTEVDAIKAALSSHSVNTFIQLDTLRHDVDTRVSTLKEQEMQKDSLERMQRGGNATIIKDYEDSEAKLNNLKDSSTDIRGRISRLEKQIHQYDIQLQQEPDVKYDTLVELKKFFDDVANSLLLRKKRKIEEDMKEQLNKLLISYKNCISKVELSDQLENFSIKLYHKSGNIISLNQLNAASKQIFIQVLLKVLRNLGDYNPPVMIDTVMGVLDEESRDVLMEEYFPDLAEQTILLCTTSEIRKDKDYIKLEPFVAKSYTLTRDVEQQCTNVESGYFGIQLSE
ncbi:MAG: AAA family ATPase [Bacteroidales bacterium]|jgi:DNA sulfur modification protein DndD|nr:AAA family ATPase [Bacteroidales bacterium]